MAVDIQRHSNTPVQYALLACAQRMAGKPRRFFLLQSKQIPETQSICPQFRGCLSMMHCPSIRFDPSPGHGCIFWDVGPSHRYTTTTLGVVRMLLLCPVPTSRTAPLKITPEEWFFCGNHVWFAVPNVERLAEDVRLRALLQKGDNSCNLLRNTSQNHCPSPCYTILPTRSAVAAAHEFERSAVLCLSALIQSSISTCSVPLCQIKNQARKRNANSNFWVRISSGGVGVFHPRNQ